MSRKTISIVFADLMGSTALQEQLDPESVNRIMDAYYQAVRGPVEAAGGTVVQLLGDGVFCAFGIPRIAEDDALRAVRAAVGVQKAFREFLQAQQWLNVPIGLRVAVNTGEVVVSDEHPAGIGDPLNVAARLQQEARDGEVLIGQATRRLVADAVTLERAGVFALKGRAETVTAYRVVSLERPTGATTAFVGRDEELARLSAVYEAAVAKPAAQLAVLLGSPGLGKSRLIAELSQRLGGQADVIAARCDAAGGATFAPIAEALRELLSHDGSHGTDGSYLFLETALADDADRARIAAGISALLAGSPASPEETFFVIRRFLAALASQRPVVLVIDDLQWAEPLLLDLVEHLIQWGSGVPLLVLAGARPELRDRRSSLATVGGFVSDVLTLSGLDAGAAMRLAANVIGAADLPAAVAAKVLATSEGNPLFVGELVRMLVDERAIERQGERWIVGANLAALEMPPTIHALLAARIERLQPNERTILERAAVVGRHFSRSAVAALLGSNGGELDARLEALRRTELIEPDSGWFLGEPVLRFHHVLIRDAAYRRLLKGTRAEMHERLANWIEGRVKDATEHDETIGWHLEQAHRLLCELGPLHPAGRVLGERAARHLSAAGRRALTRDDVPVAADLLGRAIERLDPDDPARANLALDWCEALLSAGDVGAAARAIEELGRFIREPSPGALPRADGLPRFQGSEPAASSVDLQEPQRGGRPVARGNAPGELAPPNPHEVGESRLRAWHTCFTGQLTVMTAPQELQATADAVAGAAEEFAKLGDAAGEAKSHSVHAQALARLGKVGACEAALDKALAAARKAGDRRRANAVLAGAPLAALWGPSPVTRASGRCLDVVRVLRITQGAPAVEAVALSCQGVLEALRGRPDAARRMIASSRKMVEELGIAHRLFEADVFAGRIDLLEGDAEAAERTLRGAYDGLRDLGLGIDAARAGALLGRALLAQDRAEEAEFVSRESEVLAGDDLQASIAWRGVRAEALARRGEDAEAIDLAKAGVEIAAATDALLDHADARLALAAALRAAGRSRDAEAEERHTIDLWEAKGATLLAERARRDGARVGRIANASKHERDRSPVPRGGQPFPGPLLGKEGGPERRLRGNTVTASIARFEEAVAARDVDALAALLSEQFELVHHSTGIIYGRRGMITTWRSLFNAERLAFDYELLATLGDSLALHRHLVSAEGFAEEHLRSAGPAELEEICLTELGEDGLVLRFELFAPDRLGDAVARLYERYAENPPEGLERCAATARVMGIVVAAEPGDVIDELATRIAPDFESIDHRPLSTWSQRGGAEFLEHLRALRDVADDIFIPVVDVLALEPCAVLIRRMQSGTERVGGGDYERPHLGIFLTGADGRLERYEIFDDDCQAEALARFDALFGSIRDAEQDRPPLTRGDSRGVEPPDRPPPDPLLGKEGGPAPQTLDGFANAATRLNERFVAACQDRDLEAVADMHSPSHHCDDRRRLMQMRRPIGMSMASFRVLFEAPNSRFIVTPIATRGDRLALSRAIFEGDAGHGGGPLAIDYLAIDELDDSGRFAQSVLFDPEDLDVAYDELDQRCWKGEGAAYPGHCSFMRAFGAAIASRDWTPVIARCVPSFIQEDHRSFAILGTTIGAEAWAHNFRTLTDLAPDSIYRFDHLRFVARGACAFGTWRGTHDGARFENPVLAVVELDDRGVCVRTDIYEPEQIEQVFARLQELASPAPPPCFTNVATRTVDRAMAAFAAREWDAFAALMAPEVRVYDRTRMAQLEIDGREVLVSGPTRIFEMTTDLTEKQLLATRGERLALFRVLWRGAAGDVGPSEIDRCLMVEVNERGEHLAIVYYDPEDIDAAWAELDARYAAGEGAAYVFASALGRDFSAALAQRDWDTLASLFTPGVVANDYRLVGWGTRHGPAAFIEALRAMVELAPDVRSRADHVRMSGRGVLAHVTWIGTRDGGAFESPFVWVAEIDAQGKYRRLDFYDPHHLDAAVARFEEMAAGPSGPSKSSDIGVGGQGPGVGPQYPPAPESQPPQPLAAIAKPNAASVAMDRWQATFDIAFETGDWEPMRAICAPGLLFDDRRRLALLGGDLELMITSARVRVEMGARPQLRLIGTAGDRIAVARVLWSGGPSDGPFEIEYVGLFEVDEAGQHVAMILFDGDATRAAQREAWTRWAAIDPTVAEVTSALGEVIDSWNTKDAERLRAVFAEDLIVEDHRRTGTGRSEGRDAYVESVIALWQLAPESRFEAGWFWLALAPHAAAYTARRSGKLPDGGEFESDFLVVATHADGRTTRVEIFEIDEVNAALARFEGPIARPNPTKEGGTASTFLPVSGRDRGRGLPGPVEDPQRDPLRIPPNAASAALGRISAYLDAADWDALSALCKEMVFEDRRRLFLTTGGGEQFVTNSRFVWESGMRPSYTLLATRGDRLLLHRNLWKSIDEGDAAEVETLEVFEVDEDGRIIAGIIFEPDDRVAASTELFERYAAKPADGASAELFDIVRAWNDHDLRRLRALLPDDFYLEDRRRTGVGPVEGADAYVDSIAALYELSRDVRSEVLYTVSIAEHGHVSVSRWSGTNEEGGEFDAVYVLVGVLQEGRLAGMEIFELDDLDAALARFEELRPVRESGS